MSDFVYRVCMIVPDADLDAARRIAVALGWGPDTFSYPLKDTEMGNAATHWAMSSAVTANFVSLYQNALLGTYPAEIDPADGAVLANVFADVVSAGSVVPRDQLAALRDANGLFEMEG